MTTNLADREPRTDVPFEPTSLAPHGALTYANAVRILGDDQLRAAIDNGQWVELWSGVVVPALRVRDPLTRAAAALLRAGPHSVLSGSTAVSMHGCTAADGETLFVTIPYDRQTRPLPGLSIRQAWIRESEVVELDGLRVYALDVALCELLCTGPQRTALACLEQALGTLRWADAEHFRRLVGERVARRRDRRGTRQAAALLQLAWADPPVRSAADPDCPNAPTPADSVRLSCGAQG